MWLILYLPYTGKSSLNVIVEYARDVANGCPEQNPINRAIYDIETKCETLSHLTENGQVRGRQNLFYLYGKLITSITFDTGKLPCENIH